MGNNNSVGVRPLENDANIIEKEDPRYGGKIQVWK